MSLAEIRRTFGEDGITEFSPKYGRVGAIADDTQMTLFTAEGLIRAQVRAQARGICHPPSVIHHALLRWLHTQGENSAAIQRCEERWPDGWLIEQRALFARRAPGSTCLSALHRSTRFGEQAQNDSKGCGALMRIAPVGLVGATADESLGDMIRLAPPRASFDVAQDKLPGAPIVSPLDSARGLKPGHDVEAPAVFAIACESAQSTHGHVTSTLASGFFSLVIAAVASGMGLREAIDAARPWVARAEGAQETLAAIDAALSLASATAAADAEAVERLGAGWIAEEALAISLFCALRAESFEHGVRLAVNHSGDSDSTGSLTGQLLGALWGVEAIPTRWVEHVELREVIEQIAKDLVDPNDSEADFEGRYPGW
jgi:ADP-ribosylglycohydrolase